MQFRYYLMSETLAAEGWQKGLFIDRNATPKTVVQEERVLFTYVCIQWVKRAC